MRESARIRSRLQPDSFSVLSNGEPSNDGRSQLAELPPDTPLVPLAAPLATDPPPPFLVASDSGRHVEPAKEEAPSTTSLSVKTESGLMGTSDNY